VYSYRSPHQVISHVVLAIAHKAHFDSVQRPLVLDNGEEVGKHLAGVPEVIKHRSEQLGLRV